MKSLLCVILIWTSAAIADSAPIPAREVKAFTLKDGSQVSLSVLPENAKLRARFLKLPYELQERFYQRRLFLLKRLIGVVAYPRLLGGMVWGKEKGRSVIRWLRSPNCPTSVHCSETSTVQQQGYEVLKSIIHSLDERLWRDSTYIAKASSVGVSIIVCPMWNTAIGNKGLFWAHGFSADMGVDFKNQSGYVRVYYDKQHLQKALFTFNIGLSISAFIHFRDVPANEKHLLTEHYKLPTSGGYQRGRTYRAYGIQTGVHIFEFTGALLMAHGRPLLGGLLFGSIQVFGPLMLYSSIFQRRLLAKASLRKSWIQRFSKPSCEKKLLKP